MPSQPPTPRYRVVERGRRLEVIDGRTGEPVVASPAPRSGPGRTEPTRASAGRWPSWPEQEGFDGRASLLTHRWYDAKAPRRVLIDGGTAQWIGVAKGAAIVGATALIVLAIAAPSALVVLLLPFALLRGSVRDRLRTAATGWLDRFDAPPGP